MSGLRVAVVGATGAVGREMWAQVEASDWPVDRIHAFAGSRSEGSVLPFRGRQVAVARLPETNLPPLDLVLMSAGAEASRTWSPRLVDAGALVVDNSSAFRADPECPLVVPEVNGDSLAEAVGIIANPNCSTIQMVMALAPLHREWGLESVKVATYQAVSGAGSRALAELEEGTRAHLAAREETTEVFPHPIAFNVIPQIGSVDDLGESAEEKKMRDETRRILGLESLAVSATCVRVPVLRGHSEAVWASFEETPDAGRAREILAGSSLVVVDDDPAQSRYPVPRNAAHRDEVFVGRIRQDPSDSRGLVLWVVSDNLRKGAATNAFQIASALVRGGRFASVPGVGS